MVELRQPFMPDVQRIHDYRGIVGLARLDERFGEGDRVEDSPLGDD